jgi:transposase-like protein
MGDARAYSKEFKVGVAERMAAGEPVLKLSRELGIRRKVLYTWRDNYRREGVAGIRGPGRPRKDASAARPTDHEPAARRRIAELERLVGQQAATIDFFKEALRRIEALRQPRSGSGGTASTKRSKGR